ncbi:MAG TPA: hypothetical protein VHB72_01230 [Candidatus Saccharimonadales bacterium]|nr:hypothetical protein [Candidatus Saccharimonadales bacterium]
MNSSQESKAPLQTPEYQKAHQWFADIRASLAGETEIAATASYLASINLATTAADDREVPELQISPDNEKFLQALERNLWNEHMQAQYAELQDRREALLAAQGVDIIREQFAVLQTMLDQPEIYQD